MATWLEGLLQKLNLLLVSAFLSSNKLSVRTVWVVCICLEYYKQYRSKSIYVFFNFSVSYYIGSKDWVFLWNSQTKIYLFISLMRLANMRADNITHFIRHQIYFQLVFFWTLWCKKMSTQNISVVFKHLRDLLDCFNYFFKANEIY